MSLFCGREIITFQAKKHHVSWIINQQPRLQSHHLMPRLMKLTVYEISTLHFLHSYNQPATVNCCFSSLQQCSVQWSNKINYHRKYLWRKIDHDSDDIKLGLCSRPWMRVVGRYTEWTDGMDPVLRTDIHIIIIMVLVGEVSIVTCPVSSSLTGVSSQSGCDKMSSGGHAWSGHTTPAPFLFGCCSDGELWGVMVYLCL